MQRHEYDGIGDLYAAFEQLKAKLAAQGLFAPEHKKPLPPFPGIIGIVTSSAGAAVHDMLRILNKRYPLTQVRLFPVRVQGVEAPGEIAAAIRYANHYQLADLLIVGRGGGSIEDLWAFNDERVAYAIYESRIPIISAVGHEPDVTISDYVADLRAATPSNAAELAVPDQAALLQNMDAAASAMASGAVREAASCPAAVECPVPVSGVVQPNRLHGAAAAKPGAFKNPADCCRESADSAKETAFYRQYCEVGCHESAKGAHPWILHCSWGQRCCSSFCSPDCAGA